MVDYPDKEVDLAEDEDLARGESGQEIGDDTRDLLLNVWHFQDELRQNSNLQGFRENRGEHDDLSEREALLLDRFEFFAESVERLVRYGLIEEGPKPALVQKDRLYTHSFDLMDFRAGDRSRILEDFIFDGDEDPVFAEQITRLKHLCENIEKQAGILEKYENDIFADPYQFLEDHVLGEVGQSFQGDVHLIMSPFSVGFVLDPSDYELVRGANKSGGCLYNCTLNPELANAVYFVLCSPQSLQDDIERTVKHEQLHAIYHLFAEDSLYENGLPIEMESCEAEDGKVQRFSSALQDYFANLQTECISFVTTHVAQYDSESALYRGGGGRLQMLALRLDESSQDGEKGFFLSKANEAKELCDRYYEEVKRLCIQFDILDLPPERLIAMLLVTPIDKIDKIAKYCHQIAYRKFSLSGEDLDRLAGAAPEPKMQSNDLRDVGPSPRKWDSQFPLVKKVKTGRNASTVMTLLSQGGEEGDLSAAAVHSAQDDSAFAIMSNIPVGRQTPTKFGFFTTNGFILKQVEDDYPNDSRPAFVFDERFWLAEVGDSIDYENHPQMMSEEKLSCFLKLPQVEAWLREEFERGKPDALATTLSVAAEYYAENDHLKDSDVIAEEDIKNWIAGKIEEHDPGYYTGLYLFGRLMWSEFNSVALEAVLPHLKKRLAAECSVAAELSSDDNEGFFEFFERMIEGCCDDPEVPYEHLLEVRRFIPPLNYFPEITTTNPQLSGGLRKARSWAERIDGSMRNKPPINDLETLIDAYIGLDRLPYFSYDCGYRANGGAADLKLNAFIHFDKKALSSMISGMNRNGLTDSYRSNIEVAAERILREFSVDELRALGKKLYNRDLGFTKRSYDFNTKASLLINLDYINQITAEAQSAQFSEAEESLWSMGGIDFEVVFEKIYFEKVGQRYFSDRTDSDLVDVSEGTIIVPESSDVHQIASEYYRRGIGGHKSVREASSAMAEQVLLSRHLEKTKEGHGLIQYLMQHRALLRTPELILPYPDAVNPQVIREYADHPDLFALLQITTLLQYLNYGGEQVMSEIKIHAEEAEKLHHPEMFPVGVELEQSNYEGRIINPNYAWLLNVMVQGNDWDEAHEITTARTYSPYLQSILLALMTKPEFPFLNTDGIWTEQSRGLRTNSIHVSMAIGREYDEAKEWVGRTLSDLSNAIMLAYNTRPSFMHDHFFPAKSSSNLTLGGMGIFDFQWKNAHSSVLDSQRNLSKRQRLEDKSGQLSIGGEHDDLIAAVWALGNAGLHYYMEKRSSKPGSYKPSAFRRVMADVYENFLLEQRQLFHNARPVSDVAPGELIVLAGKQKLILERNTLAVKREVNSSIVVADTRGQIVQPYKLIV